MVKQTATCLLCGKSITSNGWRANSDIARHIREDHTEEYNKIKEKNDAIECTISKFAKKWRKQKTSVIRIEKQGLTYEKTSAW